MLSCEVSSAFFNTLSCVSFPEATGKRGSVRSALQDFVRAMKSKGATHAAPSLSALSSWTDSQAPRCEALSGPVGLRSGALCLELAVRLLVHALIELVRSKTIEGARDDVEHMQADVVATAAGMCFEIYEGEHRDIEYLTTLAGLQRVDGGGVSESKASRTALPALVAAESDSSEVHSEVMSCVDSSGTRLSDDVVYRATLSSVAVSGHMPSPSQITWVAAKSTPQEVTSFVSRAAAFPKLRFAMIGVNKLAVPAREELMRAILNTHGRRARLILVLTDG